MAGNAVNPAIIALIHNIRREISPPDAVWATGCSSALLLAENINRISSIPSLSGSCLGTKSIANRIFGMPNGTTISTNWEAMAFEAILRCSLNTAACWSSSWWETSNCFFNDSICSSKESISFSCLLYLSSNSISSSTLETRCFCSKVYNVLRRSFTQSKRSGLNSMSSFRTSVSEARSFISI